MLCYDFQAMELTAQADVTEENEFILTVWCRSPRITGIYS